MICALVRTMNPIELFEQGGLLMWPILVTGVVGIFFFLERLYTLQPSKILPRDFVDRIRAMVATGRTSEAQLLCEENDSAIARLMAAALRTYRRRKPRADVKEAVEEVGNREVAHLDRNVEIVGTVASISPLLGLLGTVVGMIRVFKNFVDDSALNVATAESFASGIWTALITTAYGLSVAIPMLVLYKLLQGRNDRLVVAMEEDAMGLVDLLEDEGRIEDEVLPPTRSRSGARSRGSSKNRNHRAERDLDEGRYSENERERSRIRRDRQPERDDERGRGRSHEVSDFGDEDDGDAE